MPVNEDLWFWNLRFINLFIEFFVNQGGVRKFDCLSDSELSVFRGLNIRNLWKNTLTITMYFSLPKKLAERQASLSALRQGAGGVREMGV